MIEQNKGFLESEMKKDELPLVDAYGDLNAPTPREIIELEVCLSICFVSSFYI